MDRIRRLSTEIMEQYRDDFGVDFSDNKKALDNISIIRSKGLKNEIAGFITKYIKREIREQKDREDRERQFNKQAEARAENDDSEPKDMTEPVEIDSEISQVEPVVESAESEISTEDSTKDSS